MNALPLSPRSSALWQMLAMWALAFSAIVVLHLFTDQAKTAATVCFLYLPIWWIDRNGKSIEDFGFTTSRWRRDLPWLVGMVLVVFPIFVGGFLGFTRVIPHLPPRLVRIVTPYGGESVNVAFRLPNLPVPDSLAKVLGWLHVSLSGVGSKIVGGVLMVVDQFLVVALSEEFFYRGFMQKRLRETFPAGRTFLGVRFGPAFWITQVLFALGHLAQFHPWRLAVFFPAILFGFLREKTDSILASTCFHALCNLMVFTLEASSFVG